MCDLFDDGSVKIKLMKSEQDYWMYGYQNPGCDMVLYLGKSE